MSMLHKFGDYCWSQKALNDNNGRIEIIRRGKVHDCEQDVDALKIESTAAGDQTINIAEVKIADHFICHDDVAEAVRQVTLADVHAHVASIAERGYLV